MPGHSPKAEIKPSLKGIARALNISSDVVEEPLPDELATLSEHSERQAIKMLNWQAMAT